MGALGTAVASIGSLLRRALNATVGAVNATISGLRTEYCLAANALVEKLTRVCRHRLHALRAAVGASDLRCKHYAHSGFARSLRIHNRLTRSVTLATSIAPSPR